MCLEMNESISKKREYLVESIHAKAEEYKSELGDLYNKLNQMLVDLSLEELQELNDLSLFTDYLDYVEALKNRKLSDKLKYNSDKHINFSMIVTDDGEAVFDTTIIDDDRESAKEDAWFREHDAGGTLVFEDYDDDLEELDDDLLDNTDEKDSFLKKLNEDSEEDNHLLGEDRLISDILKQMSYQENSKEETYDELNDFLDAVNSGMSLEDIEEANKPSYDYFNDWSSDEEDEDNEDFELEDLDESEEEFNFPDANLEFNEESEKEIDNKLEEPDFKEDYKSKLEEKWGMFKINSPTITLEQMDTFSASYLALFINRGLISLPEDKSLIPDDVVDLLILGGILNERPEKKPVLIIEDLDENEDDISDDDFEVDIDLHKEEKSKQIFKNEKASERVEAMDAFRKKIGIFGSNKLKEVNEEIINPLDEVVPDEKPELVEEETEEVDKGMIHPKGAFGGFFDSIDLSILDDDRYKSGE